jgi:hypothetical protein
MKKTILQTATITALAALAATAIIGCGPKEEPCGYIDLLITDYFRDSWRDTSSSSD